VKDLQTTVERSEEDHEQNTEEDRRKVRNVGTALGGHGVNGMLGPT
jgi:hypothetical protein